MFWGRKAKVKTSTVKEAEAQASALPESEDNSDVTLRLQQDGASAEQLAEERKELAEQQELALLELQELDAAVSDAEDDLVAHLATRGNFDLLEQACESLQKLSELGVAELFWGADLAGSGERNLEEALARVDGFYTELKRLEDQHQSALGKIEGQREVLDVIDYDLYQAQQREESRKQEWIIERDANKFPERRLMMPWMRGFEEDVRFKKALGGALLASLLLGFVIPLIELPILEREELIEVPERFAKLIRKEPEPIVPRQQQQKVEKRPEETKDKPDAEKVEEPIVQPAVAVEAKPKSTREKVNSVGILAFRENFSSLKQAKPTSRLGSAARITDAGEAAQGRPERAMVTTQAAGSSGGINLAAISRDIGGGDVELVEGVQLTQVESSIDGGGTDDRPRSAGAIAGRTDEEIQIVFDKYKAGLYRLYNRELRKDPTLRGQMVLKLTIEPNGSVSLCGVQSSDMQAPDLAQRVVSSVSGFQFGAKEVPAITILYPIDFLPTA